MVAEASAPIFVADVASGLPEPLPDFTGVDLSLRAMGLADVERVAAIEARAYGYPWSKGIFRDCLRAGYQCQLALDQGRVTGYGVMSVVGGEAHLLNLCIDPDRQRGGIGSLLLDHLIALACNSNAALLFLEVRPSNAAALGLYRRYGFERIGVRKRYYPATVGRENALILAFRLSLRPSGGSIRPLPP